MIPTMLLFGLVVGRWWRLALVAGTVGWPALLVATGTHPPDDGLLAAAALAAANTGVGVLGHHGIRQGARSLLRRRSVAEAC